MPPDSVPEPTILNVLLAQARVEGKIDSVLGRLTKHGQDIETLWSRTNTHGNHISQIQAQVTNISTQLDNTVSRGYTVAALLISGAAVILTLIINLPL